MEDFANFLRAKTPSAYGIEGSGEAAYHAIKITTALRCHFYLPTAFHQIQAVNHFYRIGVAVFAVGGTKSREVVSADESFGGCTHGFKINWSISAGPNIALLQGVGSAKMVAVGVSLANGRVSGMESIGDFPSGKNFDCSR